MLVDHSDLWVKAVAGDQHAYESLHKLLYPKLYKYLFQMIRDEDIVDDLLQDFFIRMWQKRFSIGPVRNVMAYFFTAARSMAINHFRQAKAETDRLETYAWPTLDFSAEEIIISSECDLELKQIMANVLNALPARQREIIYLKFYEEMEYSRIAEVTGIKYQSVINHVYRALESLRTEFKEYKNLLVHTY